MNETKKDMIILGIVFLLILGVLILMASRKQDNQSGSSALTQNSLPQNGTGTDTALTDPSEASDVTPVQLPDEPANTTPSPANQNRAKIYSSAPQMQLVQGKDYQAVLKTNKGEIKVDLFESQTPITVNNFVFLAKDKFYDNTKFHRIIKGFMIQGGDPEGTGRGGPGYSFNDEPFTGEYEKGTLAMANAGPNTNGSQFFIMHGNTALPKNYVIFGKVMDDQSLSVVDSIAETPTKMDEMGREKSVPTEEVFINTIEIIEN